MVFICVFLRPLPLLLFLVPPAPFCTAPNCYVCVVVLGVSVCGLWKRASLCAADEDVVQGNVDCGRRVSVFFSFFSGEVSRRKGQLSPG